MTIIMPTKNMILLYSWNLPQTESMREEENKKIARHICTMETSLFAQEKLLLFLMIIFKHLNPRFVAIYYVIAGRMKIFWIRVSFLSDKSFLFLNKIPNVYLKYLQFLCDSPFHNRHNFESFALFVIQLSQEFIYIPKLTLKSAFVYCNPKILILKKCIW